MITQISLDTGRVIILLLLFEYCAEPHMEYKCTN